MTTWPHVTSYKCHLRQRCHHFHHWEQSVSDYMLEYYITKQDTSE